MPSYLGWERPHSVQRWHIAAGVRQGSATVSFWVTALAIR